MNPDLLIPCAVAGFVLVACAMVFMRRNSRPTLNRTVMRRMSRPDLVLEAASPGPILVARPGVSF